MQPDIFAEPPKFTLPAHVGCGGCNACRVDLGKLILHVRTAVDRRCSHMFTAVAMIDGWIQLKCLNCRKIRAAGAVEWRDEN